MVNPSLAYEILLYLNSFYFGMFGMCEIGMAILKAIMLTYMEQSMLIRDCGILAALMTVETLRVYLGRKGALSDHAWQVIISVILIIPSAVAVEFLMVHQVYILNLEMILCALMLILLILELIFAIWYIITSCRPQTYT